MFETACYFHVCRSTALLTLLALGACASPASGGALDDEASNLTARDGRAACEALVQSMDSAVARAPTDATYDAVLEIVIADCGASFHTAGPSHLGEHRLVRIGSMTKTYVAIVTLELVAEGTLALDQRLDSYLPAAPAGAAPVTLRQLLQHTSGIFNYTDTADFQAAYAQNPMRHWQPSELVDLAVAQPPYFTPGAGWEYSNTNFILLGMMLEHVTGRPIATLIRERILVPNGLTETFLDGSEAVIGDLSPGFDEGGHDIGRTYDLSLAWAAGAMVSTPSDEARFLGLVGTGALLPPAVQAEMTKGVDVPAEPGLQYGLGVFLAGDSITGGAGPGIGHGGDIMGFHSAGFYFPKKGMTIFGAVDSDKGSGNDVLASALGALAPAGPAPRRTMPRAPRGVRAL